jgi:hypothetical protein
MQPPFANPPLRFHDSGFFCSLLTVHCPLVLVHFFTSSLFHSFSTFLFPIPYSLFPVQCEPTHIGPKIPPLLPLTPSIQST